MLSQSLVIFAKTLAARPYTQHSLIQLSTARCAAGLTESHTVIKIQTQASIWTGRIVDGFDRRYSCILAKLVKNLMISPQSANMPVF